MNESFEEARSRSLSLTNAIKSKLDEKLAFIINHRNVRTTQYMIVIIKFITSHIKFYERSNKR